MPTIRLEGVTKLYKGGGRRIAAVVNIDLTVEQGEFVFLVGSRGAGKSTLLNIIAGDLPPDQGKAYLDDVNMYAWNKWNSRKMRRRIGRVFEDWTLTPNVTVYRNLTEKRPAALKGVSADARLVEKALGLVGMGGSEERYPAELSHSECRRIEVAKAILHSPAILLLDELNNRMDDDATWDILQLLREMNQHGTTVIMSSNNKHYINIMRKRVITLSDGKIIGDVAKGRYGDIR